MACIIYVSMFKEFPLVKFLWSCELLKICKLSMSTPRSQFSRSINVVFFTARVRKHGYHFGHDIIYNSTRHSVYSHCRKYTESWHAKFRSLISNTSSVGVIERSFSSLVKSANYFRDTTDVRQSFSINLHQIRLGNDYEQVIIFCQKSSWWKSRFFRIIIWTVHLSCGLCSLNHRKPRKREIFYNPLSLNYA